MFYLLVMDDCRICSRCGGLLRSRSEKARKVAERGKEESRRRVGIRSKEEEEERQETKEEACKEKATVEDATNEGFLNHYLLFIEFRYYEQIGWNGK